MSIEKGPAARIETERKRLLKAAHDKQIADVETWLRRTSKLLKKSRREVQRSRDLVAAL